jgi:putative spermidine/putrescine transport system ATP-binding protein
VPGETAGSTTLLLRPEDIVIVEPEIGVPCGVVRHRTFLGDRVQLRVALEDQAELLVDQKRDVKARPGDRVGLQIDTRHLMPAPPEDTP